jgi:hypothetical protein
VFFFSAFVIATDATRSDESEIKAVAAGVQIETSANVADASKLGLIHAALVQLAAQNDDGEDETERTIYGGFSSGANLPIKYSRAGDTFKVGNAAPWSRAKTAGFLAGLVANGLVTI